VGFVSKCCAKSHLPIVNIHKEGYSKLSHVVALLPSGGVYQGYYDGYCRVDDHDLQNQWDRVKMVLVDHYNGESYKELPTSKPELAQGYFMANEFLDHCLKVGKFASRKDYEKAFKELAGWI